MCVVWICVSDAEAHACEGLKSMLGIILSDSFTLPIKVESSSNSELTKEAGLAGQRALGSSVSAFWGWNGHGPPCVCILLGFWGRELWSSHFSSKSFNHRAFQPRHNLGACTLMTLFGSQFPHPPRGAGSYSRIHQVVVVKYLTRCVSLVIITLSFPERPQWGHSFPVERMLTASLLTLFPTQVPLAIPKLWADRAPLGTPPPQWSPGICFIKGLFETHRNKDQWTIS